MPVRLRCGAKREGSLPRTHPQPRPRIRAHMPLIIGFFLSSGYSALRAVPISIHVRSTTQESHYEAFCPSSPGYLAILWRSYHNAQFSIAARSMHTVPPGFVRQPSVQDVIADYEKTKKPVATHFVSVGRMR